MCLPQEEVNVIINNLFLYTINYNDILSHAVINFYIIIVQLCVLLS